MILLCGPIWEISLYPDRVQGNRSNSFSLPPFSPMDLTTWLVLYCWSLCVCVPLPGGQRVCHLARWHGPPGNVLVPMSALECGGWSERKRAQLTVAIMEGRGKRPWERLIIDALQHQFPYWSGPYCIRYSCFSCGPNAPESPHSYFLKVKESGYRKRCQGTKVQTGFQVQSWEGGLLALKRMYKLGGKNCITNF